MTAGQRRVALVTGSSRGLGAVIARRLARDGLAVAVNGRAGDEQVMAVSREIRDDGGVAEGFGADVTDAHRPPPGRSAYAAAKNAQIGLALSWARELAPSGITVNTVAPGFIPVERHADVPGEDRQADLATVPAGRMGTPDDIARAVSFFAAEEAGFVTGQRIVIDGGRGLGA